MTPTSAPSAAEEIITTIAGSGNTSGGYSGDNGPATAALLDQPYDVSLDASGSDTYICYFSLLHLRTLPRLGNVYFVDNINSVVRKVTASTGIITTIAGTGGNGYNGNGGAATSVAISFPFGLGLDVSGATLDLSSFLSLLTFFSSPLFRQRVYR